MSKWSSAFRDSRWQQKRLEVMERDQWKCQSCHKGGEGVTLNVHHIYYEKGKDPWEYENDLLITWCEDCHTKRHKIQKNILRSLACQEMWHLDHIDTMLADADFIFALCDSNLHRNEILQLIHIGGEIASNAREDMQAIWDYEREQK